MSYHRFRRVDEYVLALPANYSDFRRLYRRIENDHGTVTPHRIKIDVVYDDEQELVIRVPVIWNEEDAYRRHKTNTVNAEAETPDRYADV